jgi:hypothetical protein
LGASLRSLSIVLVELRVVICFFINIQCNI